jgi:predicted nucleic acid-binding protein
MVLIDTGYWCALGNPKDKFHVQGILVASTLKEDPVTTWPVITETCHILQRQLGARSAYQFINMLKVDSIDIFKIESSHLSRVKTLMEKYADLPMDLADASLVILAEELGHGRILSTDMRDFKTYRWKNHKPFQNLLLPDA